MTGIRISAFFAILVSVLPLLISSNNGYCEKDEKTGLCKNEKADEDEPCWYFDSDAKIYEKEVEIKEETPNEGDKSNTDDRKLVTLDGVSIGHEQDVAIKDRSLKLITRAMKPLLFEIPNFVDDVEIKDIMKQAKASGMFSSKAKGGLTPPDFFKPSSEPGKSLGPAGDFYNWDVDENDVIDMQDVLRWMKFYNFLVVNETDVHEMFNSVGAMEFDDGIITREEFENLNTQGLDDYINLMIRDHPRFRQRFSEQTWLPFDKVHSTVLHNIRERVVQLTKLPRKIVYQGEQLQVVRYGPNGHYHSHHDSETHERKDVPCCHQTSIEVVKQYGKCRICRFITIMIYLNDVEEGGETAFPAANNKTYDEDAVRIRGDENAPDYLNLSHYCHAANLVITPKRGTAVMWYNHKMHPKNGWLGERIDQSLHGGCDVKKGEKWIANIWLTAPYADSVNKPSMYFSEDDYKMAEETYGHA
eukprot:Seg190.18 transcript_id=Seg190.18/GoldUCD/mRNA.D3Y31 product="Transmembrane prolyl 4-hydroxylase" protein_id=Seg190.18/GoldUCD/D3Y31